MASGSAVRRLYQAIAAAGTACGAAYFVSDARASADPCKSEHLCRQHDTPVSISQAAAWTPDTLVQLGDLLCNLLHLPAKAAQEAGAALGGHSLQMRWTPACTSSCAAPMPLLSPALACRPPSLAAGGPCQAGPAWQPSYSAMPDASRFRQPMTGPRLAAAQRQAAARGTSTSLRAVRIAAEHAPVMAAVRRVLEERGVALPPSHFADADVELARYAVTVGLLAAETPQDRESVVEAAATRAQQTIEWLESHSFMPEDQLGNWAHVVHWAADDAEGHPVLVVHLAAALQQDAAAADAAAEAILAHMEYALAHLLADEPGRPEQLTVVLESHGAPTLQFRKLVRTIQNIALTLNRHYPARLHRLFLVGAPAIVHLPVRAIRAMLHPSTSSKIIICDPEDPRLPTDITAAAGRVVDLLQEEAADGR